MTSEQANKSTSDYDDEITEDAEPVRIETGELDEAVDDLLADIDEALEENAEEFVASFRQRGGQ